MKKLKQSISFQKNHDNFNLVITGNFIKKAWIITKINFFNFNKSTELLFVQLRLFDDWKEEFRSWANKSRSLAIGAGFAAMSNPAKKIIKIPHKLL